MTYKDPTKGSQGVSTWYPSIFRTIQACSELGAQNASLRSTLTPICLKKSKNGSQKTQRDYGPQMLLDFRTKFPLSS